MMAQFVIDVLIMDESHAGVLLMRKARRLRHMGRNWAVHAKVSPDVMFSVDYCLN